MLAPASAIHVGADAKHILHSDYASITVVSECLEIISGELRMPEWAPDTSIFAGRYSHNHHHRELISLEPL